MSDALLSVVVPAYNAAATIGDCVAALRGQTLPPGEIIVVDDGSDDETAIVARAAGATVLSTPRGRPAAARNAGIRAARGAIVCCTDADCAPRPDWLAQLVRPFADSAVVACKGTYATRQTSLVARFVQLEYEDKYDLLRTQESIDFIDTYSAAYRRDVLLANDGFDERFDYLEDQELSFRLAARGYHMVFQPAAVVEHHHSATVRAYLRKKALIGYWKAQVVRRFPGRAAADSHTPQVMKVQMALALLILAGLGVALLAAPFVGRWGVPAGYLFAPVVAAVALFFLTTLPFARKCWVKDRAVALAAPALLFGRAAALGIGYGWGVVRPRPGLSGEASISGLAYLIKRGLDIGGGLIGLIFTGIVWPPIALLIKLDSEGPVLFRQERIGERGHPFTMLKFRTMHVGAAEQWPQLISARGLNEPVLKLADDPRLTRAGRFLRRWSLDELPQFWNVLRGEMSLVGPRPEEPRIVAHYTDQQRRRLAVRPGLTGPMQILGRADLTLEERVTLDVAYIEQFSLGRDLAILARTLPAVLRGRGGR